MANSKPVGIAYRDPDLTSGWAIDGVAVLPTATELNALVNTPDCGTAAPGVTAVEYGNGGYHRTVLTVDTVLPAIAGGAALGVGVLLYTLPAGVQVIGTTYMSLAITQTQGNINADTPDGGIGTTIASGAISFLNGTTTFENLLTGQTFNDCNGTAEVKTTIPTASLPYIIDAGSAKTIYFNVADSWAAGGDTGALLEGTVVILWQGVA